MMSTTIPPESTSPPTTQPQLTHARPMLAMLKKEFRELLPGGVVFTCILGVIYFVMMLSVLPRVKANRVGEYLNSAFQDLTLVAVPLITMCLCGILMGGIQFYKESKIDSFAFLVHRPFSRSSIFLCRVLVAHIMILLAALLPTLALYAWASAYEVANEHLLPLWLLRTISGLFAASGSYFFGVLIVTRVSAHWYGSLFMPIMWGVLLGIWAGTRDSAWAFCAIAMLGLVPMFIASHGSFTSFSQIRIQPWYARLSLGLLILAGQGWLMFMAAGITNGIAPRGSMEPEAVIPVIQKDGTPIQLYTGEYFYKAAHSLDGKCLQVNPDTDTLLPIYCTIRVPLVTYYRPERFVFPSQNRIYTTRNLELDGHSYLLSGRPGKYFLLYEGKEGAKVGVVDAEGIKLGSPVSIVPFKDYVMPLDGNKVIIGNGIYDVISGGKLSLRWTLPDDLPFTHIATLQLGRKPEDIGKFDDLFIATAQHMYLVDFPALKYKNELIIKKQWSREPGDWEINLIWQENDQLVVRYDAIDHSKSMFVFTSDGHRIIVPAPHRTTPPMQVWPWGEIIPKSSFGIGIHTIIATDLISRNQSLQWTRDEFQKWLWQLPEAKAINTCTLIISTLAAVATWLLMSRQSFTRGRKILWSALAFICGPAILLLRPVIVPSRVLELCPDCHKKRPVELTACPHCNNPWPPPPRDGREIIA